MSRRGVVQLSLLATLLCGSIHAGTQSAPSAASAPDTTLTDASSIKINQFRDIDGIASGSWGPSQVVLVVTGQSMKHAVAFANFRVEQAIDNAGENLVDSDDSDLRTNTNIHVAQHVRHRDGIPSIKVTALIRTPPRRATKLLRLNGQVQVMTISDESRSLVIPKLASFIARGGQMKGVGSKKLSVWMGIDQGDNGKNLYGYLNGNPTIIRRIEIIDASGILLKQGYIPDDYDDRNNKMCSFFKLPRIVDDQMSLKIEVAATQKVVTVRFDLKDIPLP